jgi:alpha-glucosidase
MPLSMGLGELSCQHRWNVSVLAREGSLLPMEEDGGLTLHIYVPRVGEGRGWLYSDAGDGYGDWRLDRFHFMREAKLLTLSWEREGDYPFAYSHVQLQLHGFEARRVWVDDAEVAHTGGRVQVGLFNRLRMEAV